MTNERAIRIVAELTADNSKEDVTTKVFVCEDILEDDVNMWLNMPASSHLNQFIDHNNSIASRFIDSRCEIFGYDEGVRIEMHNLRDKMESVMVSMIRYAAIFEAIDKESRSER